MAKYHTGDTLARLAQGLGGLAGGLSDMGNALYEADRVNQINTGATEMARSFSLYNRDVVQKKWDKEPAADGSMIQNTLGQIDPSQLQADHDKQVQTMREWLGKNITNAQARQYLEASLEQKAVSNFEQVYGVWETLHVHELVAQSDRNINNALENNDSPAAKKDAVRLQLAGDVATGVRYADDAAVYRAKLDEQIDSSWAYGEALKVAQGADYNPAASDKWIDANTDFWANRPDKRAALKNVVRGEIDRQRSELDFIAKQENTARNATWGDLVVAAADDRKILSDYLGVLASDKETEIKVGETVTKLSGDFKKDTDSKMYWEAQLRNRLSAIDAAAARGSSSADVDKIDDATYTGEYMRMWVAMSQKRPLTEAPKYGPPATIAPSLVKGGVPTQRDLINYLLNNRGSMEGKPRVSTSYADGEIRKLQGERPPILEKAVSLIYASTEAKTNPLPMATALEMVIALDDEVARGSLEEGDIPKTVASWITNKAVGKVIDDNLPLKPGVLTGKWKTDTTEAFINGAANSDFYNWQFLPTDQRQAFQIAAESHAQVIGKRVADVVGKSPTKHTVRDNGEVWFYYEDPARPGDTSVGVLYRYRPQTQDSKTKLFSGNTPVLQKGNGTVWEDVKETKPQAQRQQESLDAEKAAERQAAAEAKDAQLNLDDWTFYPKAAPDKRWQHRNGQYADTTTATALDELNKKDLGR